MKVLILILSLVLSIRAQGGQNASLELVVELFRHGARAPESSAYDTSWGDTYGELTGVGMRMHYILGAAIAQNYSSFLLPYNPGNIYVRSTDYNRTIMSAYSQLYGIYLSQGPTLNISIAANLTYPPYNLTQAVIDNVTAECTNSSGTYALPNAFQPIPVHVVEASEDTFLLSYEDACPNSGTQLLQGLNSQQTLNAYQFYMPFVDEINQRIQNQQPSFSPVTSADNLTLFADALICDYYNNNSIPLGYSPSAPNWTNLTFAYGYFLDQIYYGNPQYVQIYSVPFYQNLIGYLNSTVNGSSNLEFLFLSAHDTTLALVLASLNLTTPTCLWNNFMNSGIINDSYCHYPKFASNIVIELWNDSNGYYIKFYYDDVLLTLPGCSSSECPYAEFLNLTNLAQGGYTMNNYTTFCNVPISTSGGSSSNTTDIIIICVLGGLSLIMIVALVMLCMAMRTEQRKIRDGTSLVKNSA